MDGERDRAEAVDLLRTAALRLKRAAERAESGELIRQELEDVVADLVRASAGLFGPRPHAVRGEGAKRRILNYLLLHVGEDVAGVELAAVSGIQEWARRIRELRVEEGYDIAERGGSTYRLRSPDPDLEQARRWQRANEIRRRPGSALERIQAFLLECEGEVVTREEIDYVAKIHEGSRRVRELRDEHGLPINSHIDEPELRPGEYRLVSTDPADRRDQRQRLYPEAMRERIFARDRYTCTKCGRTRETAVAAGDTRFYLEVHHIHAVAEELEKLLPEDLNREENLVTLCHRDHIAETAALQARRRAQRRNP